MGQQIINIVLASLKSHVETLLDNFQSLLCSCIDCVLIDHQRRLIVASRILRQVNQQAKENKEQENKRKYKYIRIENTDKRTEKREKQISQRKTNTCHLSLVTCHLLPAFPCLLSKICEVPICLAPWGAEWPSRQTHRYICRFIYINIL